MESEILKPKVDKIMSVKLNEKRLRQLIRESLRKTLFEQEEKAEPEDESVGIPPVKFVVKGVQYQLQSTDDGIQIQNMKNKSLVPSDVGDDGPGELFQQYLGVALQQNKDKDEMENFLGLLYPDGIDDKHKNSLMDMGQSLLN